MRKISGMNTAQVVRTELSIAPRTSLVPSMTALRRASPRCQRAVMLSVSTMVLSTIMPTPTRGPDREMMLMVRPHRWKTSMDRTRAEGIVRETSAGLRKSCMKRKITRQARITPRMIFHMRLWMEYSSSSVWSRVTVNASCG